MSLVRCHKHPAFSVVSLDISNISSYATNVLEQILIEHVMYYKGKHYKSTPDFSVLTPREGQLLVRLIAVNSGYTSRVLVWLTFFYKYFIDV